MPNALADRPVFVGSFIAMLLSSYLAIGGRRALMVLFSGQAADRRQTGGSGGFESCRGCVRSV